MANRPAFRCKNCGRFEECSACGVNATPHSCRGCGKGVRYCPDTGTKTSDHGNWEVLSEASDERLEELGLKRDEIDSHDGVVHMVAGALVERAVAEQAVAKTKTASRSKTK